MSGCSNCQCATTNFCKDCDTPYCSTQCMRDDARVHMSYCNKLAGNADVSDSSSVRSSLPETKYGSRHSLPKTEKPLFENSRFASKPTPAPTPTATPTTKPAPLGFPSRFVIDDAHKAKENVPVTTDRRSLPSSRRSLHGNETNFNRQDRVQPPPLLSENRRDETPADATKTKNTEGAVTDLAHTLSTGNGIEVFCLLNENSGYWVVAAENVKQWQDISNELNRLGSGLPCVPPSLNLLCVAPYEGLWYRGKVVSVKPLKVFYIDYGNTSPCKEADLRMLPDNFSDTPPLALFVKMTEPSDKLEVNKKANIRLVGSDNDVKFVEIVRKKFDQNEEKTISNNDFKKTNKPFQENGGNDRRDGRQTSSNYGYRNELKPNERRGTQTVGRFSTDSNARQRFDQPQRDGVPSVNSRRIEPAEGGGSLSQKYCTNFESKGDEALNNATSKSPSKRSEKDSRCSVMKSGEALSNATSKPPSIRSEKDSRCSATMSQSSKSDIKSVFELLGEGVVGHVSCEPAITPTDIYMAMTPENMKELNPLRVLVLKCDKTTSPTVGKLVTVPDGEIGTRGLVLSVDGDNIQVALVDCIDIINTKTVYTLDEDLWDVPYLGAIGRITNNSALEREVNAASFRILKQIGSGWMCEVKGEASKLSCVVSKWDPSSLLIPKSGALVEIVRYCGISKLYVSSADKEGTDAKLQLLNRVAAAATAAPPLEKTPAVGELLAALFLEDKCFYRSEVTKVEGDDVHVTFIDFGNTQKVSLKDLRQLPSNLRSLPPFALFVPLSGVPDVTSEVGALLIQKAMCEETTFIMTYQRLLTEGVTLKYPSSGEILNDRLKEAATPDWKKTSNGTEKPLVLKLDDVKVLEMPIGDEVMLTICYCDEESVAETGLVFCLPAASNVVAFVHGEMTTNLAEYCSSLPEAPYRPRPGEMCAAFYNGEWARAYCTADGGKVTVHVNFIDYGNDEEMDTAFVRPLCDEFKRHPAVSVECYIKGIDRANTAAKREKVKNVIIGLVEQIVTASVSVFNENSYEIVLPAVEKILR